MLSSKRQREIIKLLQRDGHVTTHGVAEFLQVSPVTVRRDLKALEEEGVLRRSYGGAVLANESVAGVESYAAFAPERTYAEKAKIEHEAKARIGQAASEMVRDGETIMLEAGTTVAAMLPGLRTKRGLTVVTNALNVAWEMTNRSDARVVYLGGQIRPSSYAAVGPLTEAALQDISVQRLFIGADGISVDAGVTTPSHEETVLAHHMMSRASETVVLADNTKFGRVALSRIGSIGEFSAIITDARLGKEQVRACERAGARLILV